jgi:hypothetical protein
LLLLNSVTHSNFPL